MDVLVLVGWSGEDSCWAEADDEEGEEGWKLDFAVVVGVGLWYCCEWVGV